jgi:translation initiation factor IF-1
MISAKHNFYGKITWGVSVLLIIFSLIHPSVSADTIEFQKVDQDKIPDELAMIADITKYNYEKIKTWQGKISSESTYFYDGKGAADLVKQSAGVTIKEPNELATIGKGTSEFKIDMGKNILFKSMNRSAPVEYVNLDTELIYLSSSDSYQKKKVITGEYEIESSPYTFKKDGTITSCLAEKKIRYPEQDFDESDPRHCFSIGKMPWVLLPIMSEGVRRYNKDPNGSNANGPNSAFSSISLEKAQTEKGTIYRLLINSTFEMKYTFDEKNGFNPTHIEAKNAKGIKISEGDIDWVKIQDIYLPAERRVTQYDGKDGRLRRQATSTYSDMQVNMPLSENTFSINNLGLKNGDKFIDKIAGKEYKYEDANLVFVADVNK